MATNGGVDVVFGGHNTIEMSLESFLDNHTGWMDLILLPHFQRAKK
jgi:hypothetical protein